MARNINIRQLQWQQMTQGWVNPLSPNTKIQILICYPMCFQYEGTHSSFLKECWFSSKPTLNINLENVQLGNRGTQVYQFWSFEVSVSTH